MLGSLSAPLVSATALSAALMIGCTSGTNADETLTDADIQRVVIGDLVDRSGVVFETGAERGLPVLYVEAFGPEDVPLEVQVDVVAGWQETYDIRYIDDRSEAVDEQLEGRPVRKRSLLLGLGPITRNGTAELRGEYYRAEDLVGAFRYTLTETAEGWRTTTDPVPIEPEGFVSAP